MFSTRYWLPVASCLLLVGWGANQFASMLVFYQRTHGFSEIAVTSMLGIYVAGLVPALLLGGRLSDRLGRKPATILALALTVLGSLALVLGTLTPVMIFVGRLIAGVATGVAMAAGTSWVKELSHAPWDEQAGPSSGARRASLFTTAGFWLGPVVAGLLANWLPAPDVVPFLFHVLLCLPLFLVLPRIPEAKTTAPAAPAAVQADRRYAFSAGQQRFRRVVGPGAPWVFASGTVGFAVVPSLMVNLGEQALLYATAAVALTLGAGVGVQSLARRLDDEHSARATLTAISTSLLGLLIALAAASAQWPLLGLVASTLLGSGYGLMLVAGLSETQRLSSPESLGSNTGKFYTLAYAGFLAPTVLAFLSQWFTPLALLVGVIVLALASLIVISANSRRFLPAPH